MRLLQAMAGRRRGGAERFFARLALAFGRAHIEQRLLVRDGAACSAWLEAGGLRPVTLPFGGWLDTASARRFGREAAAFRPDVVLTWMNRASAFCPRANGFVHIGRLGGYYNLKYYRGCAHLIANTRDIADYVRREGWTRPVHYVPNFAELETTPALPRAALATPEDVPLLLAVGRLHRNKGFDVLLKALAMVAEAHLWLAGTGPLETELERTAARSVLGTGCTCWAGATTSRRCTGRPMCLSVRRATSRSATSSSRRGPTTPRWWQRAPRDPQR